SLHMLRREIGDSAFFRGLRSYYMKYRHGNALTQDLQHELEVSSGTTLDWFFEQWFERPGYADLGVSWRYDQARRTVMVTVSQGDKRPPYRLTLPIEITTATGKVVRSKVVVPATRVGTIPVPATLDGAPKIVRFDPDVSLLATITSR
ncbi:MAG: M1 family aminopeptidase, partial [Gemmatimonadaceae bacterium]